MTRSPSPLQWNLTEGSPFSPGSSPQFARDDPLPEITGQSDGGLQQNGDTLNDVVYDFTDISRGLALLQNQSGNGTSGAGNELFKIVLDYLALYFTPLIIVVGLVGNGMAFSVFAFTHLRTLSSSFYLSTLAMADIGYLLGLSLVWLGRVGLSLYGTDGWCQCVQYVLHVCGFVAVWTVVSFTGERYIIVYHPLRKDAFCTKAKARIVTVCLLLFALVFYAYIVVTFQAVKFGGPRTACFPVPKYDKVFTMLGCIDSVIGCVIPSLLIIVLNIKIMVKIHQYQKKKSDFPAGSSTLVLRSPDRMRRRSGVLTSVSTSGSMRFKFSTTKPPYGTPVPVAYTQQLSTHAQQEIEELTSPTKCSRMIRGRNHFRTARMLLVLSSVFVLLNLPIDLFSMYRILESLFVDTPPTKLPKNHLTWRELFEMLYFLNFAINIFIYSLCGQQFRSGLARLGRRLRYKVNKLVEAFRNRSVRHRGRHQVTVRQEGFPVSACKPAAVKR